MRLSRVPLPRLTRPNMFCTGMRTRPGSCCTGESSNQSTACLLCHGPPVLCHNPHCAPAFKPKQGLSIRKLATIKGNSQLGSNSQTPRPPKNSTACLFRVPAVERIWHMLHSQGQMLALEVRPKSAKPFTMFPLRSEARVSIESGTYKTVKARFWPWLSGKSPLNPL